MKPDEGSSEELCEVHCPRSVIVDSVEDAFLAIWEEMVEAMNCLDEDVWLAAVMPLRLW